MRRRQSRRPSRVNIVQEQGEKDKDNCHSKDDLFDLDSIPMEVLDKGFVSYRQHLAEQNESENNGEVITETKKER